jgi:hypothetical protein
MVDPMSAIRATGANVTPVGSRMTCNPAPTDTDEDYLVWTHDPASENAVKDALNDGGWVLGGSAIPDEANTVPMADRFWAYRNGNFNLIVTRSQPFAHRFLAASSIAKRLNLLNKADRIALFQAVLYGRIDDANAIMPLPQLDEVVF